MTSQARKKEHRDMRARRFEKTSVFSYACGARESGMKEEVELNSEGQKNIFQTRVTLEQMVVRQSIL